MRRPEVLLVLVFAGCKAPPTDAGSTSPCADRTGDGRPSDVEGDKAYWIDQLGQWCPWDTLVTEVDDRR